jgi:hypothetical protein
VASLSGHSMSSVSSPKRASSRFGTARTRKRAKRDCSFSFVPSRRAMVRQACFGRLALGTTSPAGAMARWRRCSPRESQRPHGPSLWCVARQDLFAPAIAPAGLLPDCVVYVGAGDEPTVLTCFEEALRHGELSAVVEPSRRQKPSDRRRPIPRLALPRTSLRTDPYDYMRQPPPTSI